MTTRPHALSERRTTWATFTKVVAAVAGVLALVTATMAFTATAANADPPGKVAVCHYVPGEGNTPPNWTYIPSMSWEGWLNGHAAQHPEDRYGPENGTIADCGTLPPPPPPPPEKKVDICHTTNGVAPFIVLNVGESAVPGHVGHGDLYPVPATGCPTGPTPTYVDICHTGTGGAPYGLLSILDTDVATHQGHGDVYPVPSGGCPTPPVTCPAGQTLVNGVCTLPPSNPPTTPETPATVSAPEAATVEPETPIVIAAPEPATVAAPEPATVAVPEPAKVAVPMKATVPSAVRAGDGSSQERGLNSGLVLLALASAGVCLAATSRLVLARTK